MENVLTVVSCTYNASNHNLKIIYSNGLAALYHPVPLAIYHNLLRRSDKAAFIEKYLEYDLNFNKIYSV